jgi:hypothetical protein
MMMMMIIIIIHAVTEVSDLVATDHQMTIKRNINCTFSTRQFSRCFKKILNRGSYTHTCPRVHTHTHTHTHTQSHILERRAQSCNWQRLHCSTETSHPTYSLGHYSRLSSVP